MKVIVAGGRFDNIHKEGEDYLLHLVRSGILTTLVCGMADGIDMEAHNLLKPLVPIDEYPALWNDLSVTPCLVGYRKDGSAYNKLAGSNRNEVMAQNADAVVLFPGGTGTAHMRSMSKKYGLQILKDFGEILY